MYLEGEMTLCCHLLLMGGQHLNTALFDPYNLSINYYILWLDSYI